MNAIDEETVEALLASSTPEGRRRYHEEEFYGTPAYDHPTADPRCYVVPCANPRCPRRVLVGCCGRRRYCSHNCVALAWYWRNRDRKSAYQRVYQRAYRARKRREVA